MKTIEVEKHDLYALRMTGRDEHYNDVVLSEHVVWFDESGMHFGPPL